LLPGSRLHEVEKIFPDALKAALTVSEKFGLQPVVACSSNINENIFFKISGQRNFKVVKNYTYDLLKYSKLGIIKSGTSTLEAGLFELPMVIVYKTNYLTYLIGKNLVKVNNIGMANIIAGVKIAPELIQNQFTEHTLIDECSKILSTPELYLDMKTKLKSLKEKLGVSGASGRAAHIIYDMMNES
jgi:lipid-A-disaccharide synthase